jgi:hypothetical protein
MVTRTRVLPPLSPTPADPKRLTLQARDGLCVVTCADGASLAVLEARDSRGPVDFHALLARLAQSPIVVS